MAGRAEGGGLAGAGVGPADQVPARQDQRDALCLDRGRLGVADLRHRPGGRLRKGKVLKYHKNTSLSLRPGPLPQRICPPADGVFPFGRKKQAAPVSPAPPVLLLWVIVYHTCAACQISSRSFLHSAQSSARLRRPVGGCPLRPPAGLQRVGGAAAHSRQQPSPRRPAPPPPSPAAAPRAVRAPPYAGGAARRGSCPPPLRFPFPPVFLYPVENPAVYAPPVKKCPA